MKKIKTAISLFLILLIAVPYTNADESSIFITDTSYYFATSHEGKIKVKTDIMSLGRLKKIPYSLGSWKGKDIKHNDPNLSFFRRYKDKTDGTKIYALGVYARDESKLHTPEVCYINDNWNIQTRDYNRISLEENQFDTRYFLATKKKWKHYVTYWFMWPDSNRIMNNGCVMIRLAVSMKNNMSTDKARQKTLEFISQLSGFTSQSSAIEESTTAEQKLILKELANKNSPHYKQRKQTLEWLIGQVVPNNVLQNPTNNRRNLILSYELTPDAPAYKYIFSKSSLYDNALAAIAFTIEKQDETARKILDAIMRMGGKDGELFFTFNTHNSWPNKNDNYGAIIRSGASAWAGYAFVFYLRARLMDDADALKHNKELQQYLGYAELIANNMLKRHVSDPRDERSGLITGGKGSYRLSYNKEKNIIDELFIDKEVTWCSIEHNIDMYFFLSALAKISSNPKYMNIARQMADTLINRCWNTDYNQFNRGLRLDGADTVRALDCASWGALFLKAKGLDTLADKALAASLDYRCTTPKGFGYKAYVDKPIYANRQIAKFYFDNPEENSWDKLNMMWTEGALGVSLAYLRLNNKPEAREIIDEVMKYQTQSGGIKYASESIEHEFATAPSVASGAWLIINLASLEENKTADLFWDE